MDIYSENSGPVDMTGHSSSRPDESKPPRRSIHSADFKPTNADGLLRASPTHFDDSSRGFHSQANPLHLPRPVATRSGESPTEGFGIPRRNDRSTVDWIVPLSNEEKNTNTNTTTNTQKTFGERLEPTLKQAEEARDKYIWKAKLTGYALNVAIGFQVLLGSLTTAISAATTGRQTSIGVTILGGLSTIVASYLARTRGSNEPELSTIRVKDLDQFIRECQAFILDSGHLDGHEHDEKVIAFRGRFEELLGNGNGERRLATV